MLPTVLQTEGWRVLSMKGWTVLLDQVLLVALGAIFTTTLDELVILTVLFAEAAAGVRE